MKKSSVKQHFTDHAAGWIKDSYDGDGFEYPTARHRMNVVCEILGDLPAPARITDLGCGGGHLAGRLAEMGHDVTGIDQSAEMIRLASAHTGDLAPDVQARIQLRQAELEDLADGARDQDVVTAMGVIGYLDDDTPMFDAAGGLLKDGGLFLLSCRNRLFNMTSISHRTHREIENGDASALLNETVSHQETLSADLLRDFAANLISAGEELMKISGQAVAVSASDTPPKAAAPMIEARQHTPDGIREEARKHGFEAIGMHGVHPHLLPPHMRKRMPPFTYNLLSATLEPLHAAPASLGWSSVFIAVLRKAAT